jgi:WD40 repeat protein
MKKNLFIFSLFFALSFAHLLNCSDVNSDYETNKTYLQKNLKLINQSIALFNKHRYNDSSELYKAKAAICKALNSLSCPAGFTQFVQVHEFIAHDDSNHGVLFTQYSPDGQYLATCSHDKTVKIWDAQTFQLIQVLRHMDPVYNFEWSPDCQNLVSAAHNSINIWDIQTGQLLKQINERPLRSVLWSRDGKYIVSLSFNSKLKLWSSNGDFIELLDAGYNTTSICWNADNNLVSASKIVTNNSRYYLAQTWDIDNKTVDSIRDESESFHNMAFSNTNLLAIPCYSSVHRKNCIKFYNTKTNVTQWTFGHETNIACVQFSPNGKLLASCDERVIKICDINGNLLQILQGHTNNIRSLSWSPDNTRLASASYDKTVKIWDLQ